MDGAGSQPPRPASPRPASPRPASPVKRKAPMSAGPPTEPQPSDMSAEPQPSVMPAAEPRHLVMCLTDEEPPPSKFRKHKARPKGMK